jgi:aconitate hydratase
MPYWSNVYETAKFAFEALDPDYYTRSSAQAAHGGHAIVAGNNYGQGSSRENAALVPALLGLRVVVARSYARIHWQNLICFGVLPLSFTDPDDYPLLKRGAMLAIDHLHEQLRAGDRIEARTNIAGRPAIILTHTLSSRQLNILKAGGIINQLRPPKNN